MIGSEKTLILVTSATTVTKNENRDGDGNKPNIDDQRVSLGEKGNWFSRLFGSKPQGLENGAHSMAKV